MRRHHAGSRYWSNAEADLAQQYNSGLSLPQNCEELIPLPSRIHALYFHSCGLSIVVSIPNRYLRLDLVSPRISLSLELIYSHPTFPEGSIVCDVPDPVFRHSCYVLPPSGARYRSEQCLQQISPSSLTLHPIPQEGGNVQFGGYGMQDQLHGQPYDGLTQRQSPFDRGNWTGSDKDGCVDAGKCLSGRRSTQVNRLVSASSRRLPSHLGLHASDPS